MPCKACIARGKTWDGDDPRCAFEMGVFSSDNWQCATLDGLRELVFEGQDNMPDGVAYTYCEDQKYATVRYDEQIGRNEGWSALCLWVTWYKNRGTTSQIWVMSDDELPRRPTEDEIVAIVDYYRGNSHSNVARYSAQAHYDQSAGIDSQAAMAEARAQKAACESAGGQ